MNTKVSDAELVRNLLLGEAKAWEGFFARLRQRIRAIPFPSNVDKEELVCDTLTAVWQSLRSLREGDKLLLYATRIAKRLARDRVREAGRLEPIESEPISAGGGPDNLEAEELLEALIHPLQAADRTLFRLLFVTGAASQEIEALLSISGARLRLRKHRLRKKLQAAARRLHFQGAFAKPPRSRGEATSASPQ